MTTPLSQQSIDFLWELSINNERPWFLEHKERFEEVLHRPFKELANETARLMQDRHPDLGLTLHISRIYRDARRLFGRGPYHDHLWFSLQRGDAKSRGPMFWFEFGLEGTSHGLGFWDRNAEQAAIFRRCVELDPEGFRELVLGIPDRERSRLWGEEYKRPKGHFDDVIDPWYNRRQASVGYDNYFGQELFTQNLPGLLADSFEGLLPMYGFFLRVYDLSRKESE